VLGCAPKGGPVWPGFAHGPCLLPRKPFGVTSQVDVCVLHSCSVSRAVLGKYCRCFKLPVTITIANTGWLYRKGLPSKTRQRKAAAFFLNIPTGRGDRSASASLASPPGFSVLCPTFREFFPNWKCLFTKPHSTAQQFLIFYFPKMACGKPQP
jgi:hypothetical protein